MLHAEPPITIALRIDVKIVLRAKYKYRYNLAEGSATASDCHKTVVVYSIVSRWTTSYSQICIQSGTPPFYYIVPGGFVVLL